MLAPLVMQGWGASIGGLLGAAAGAVLGAITGGGKDVGRGAVIGGAVGAVGVRELSRRLNLPYETVRRHAVALARAGQVHDLKRLCAGV